MKLRCHPVKTGTRSGEQDANKVNRVHMVPPLVGSYRFNPPIPHWRNRALAGKKNGHFMTIGQKFGTSLQKKKKRNIVKGK